MYEVYILQIYMFQIPQCCTNFTKKNPTTSPLFTTYFSSSTYFDAQLFLQSTIWNLIKKRRKTLQDLTHLYFRMDTDTDYQHLMMKLAPLWIGDTVGNWIPNLVQDNDVWRMEELLYHVKNCNNSPPLRMKFAKVPCNIK